MSKTMPKEDNELPKGNSLIDYQRGKY